ncbi:MAG: 3-oxoacyl-ACP synthase, partial [Candidatus Binatia bacterium]
MSIADAFIRTGQYENVLVIGSEIHSTGLDLSTRGRDVSVLFGDGAGAALVGRATDDKHMILSS